jgi:hypothetical protein
LDEIRKNLGIGFDDLIRKAQADPGTPFIWVDWGCGDGEAVHRLALRLTVAGVSNVRLVAFADAYSPQWERVSSKVTFILDTADNFFKYFKDRSISVLFSNYGLIHVGKGSLLLDYIRRLGPDVAPAGEVFLNMSKKTRLFLQEEAWLDWTPEGVGEDVMHLTRADRAETGGIDLNANNMDIRTTGSGARFEIPSGIEPAGPGAWEGLAPVIVSITPLESSRVFLGTPAEAL